MEEKEGPLLISALTNTMVLNQFDRMAFPR